MDKGDVAHTHTQTHTDTHRHTHTMKYYSAIKQNEILLFKTTWMDSFVLLFFIVSVGCCGRPALEQREFSVFSTTVLSVTSCLP